MKKYVRFRVNKLIPDNIPDILAKEGNYRSISYVLNEKYLEEID